MSPERGSVEHWCPAKGNDILVNYIRVASDPVSILFQINAQFNISFLNRIVLAIIYIIRYL